MELNQDWVEFSDTINKDFQRKVWIPVRALQVIHKSGELGHLGYVEDFFRLGCIMVPVEKKDITDTLEWNDVDSSGPHCGYFQDDVYKTSDTFEIKKGQLGVNLILDQSLNRIESDEWHLHQDFVLTLGLKREGDIWLAASEGYEEVARLTRNQDGEPALFEIKAQFLKDYLCARNMGLFLSFYHSRQFISVTDKVVNWREGNKKIEANNYFYEGRVLPIHEGGMPYGSGTSVLHLSRTDIDFSEDLPDISKFPGSEHTETESWVKEEQGGKLYTIMGELWKKEWIAPGKISKRVRGDYSTPTVFFITDEEGNKENSETLVSSGKWLWFKPEVVMSLAHQRGGGLTWYTRNTGGVGGATGAWVHFGVNDLGLVNVYAKDIAMLPEWQQQVWSGFNTAPEGGVSVELLEAQVRAVPSDTKAPEAYIRKYIDQINTYSKSNLGILLFRDHESLPNIIEKIHRFRACNEAGLLALAKDVARITADSIDAKAIQSVISPPPKTSWGSLKSLENLIALKAGKDKAHDILGILVGIYELRHADAHLPSSQVSEAFKLIGIDRNKPFVTQGFILLNNCVATLSQILKIIANWESE